MGADYKKRTHTQLMWSSAGTWLTPNATLYYVASGLQGGGQAAVGDADDIVTEHCMASHAQARVGAAAGAGESWVFTLMVDGFASALTVTIGGAVDVIGDDLVNEVALVPGNMISWRVVGSALAAGTRGRASFSLREY